MPSKREQVIAALAALMAAALPHAAHRRNAAKPSSIPPGGAVIVHDGDPGEPDHDLSPLRYTYQHRIMLDVAAPPGVPDPEAFLDESMLSVIGGAIAADRTLGGLCEWVEPEAPATGDAETEGAEPARWAAVSVLAIYSTPNPLN